MIVTFPIIAEALKNRFPDEVTVADYVSDMEIKHTSLKVPEVYDRNTLYITGLSGMRKAMPPCFLCLLGEYEEPVEIPPECCGAFIRTGSMDSCADVLAEVMNIMSNYVSWCDEMLEAVKEGRDYYELVEIGHKVFNNPMIIYDSSMKILAYTRDDGSDDDMWVDTVSAGTAIIENEIDSEELKRYVNLINSSTKPFMHMGKGMTDPFYTSVINANGQRMGVVTEMQRHHEIGPGEQQLLEIFCEYICIRMQQEFESGGRLRDRDSSFVQDLINQKITSEGRLLTSLTAISWNTFRYFTFVQFIPTITYVSYDHRKRILNRLTELRLSGKGCLAENDRAGMYYIFSHKTPVVKEDVTETLRDFCINNNLRCACSDPYESLLDTYRYVPQTDAVLELTDEITAMYSKIRFRHLLSSIKKNDDWQNMMHPAVKILKQEDDANGTEYIKTLKAYISNEFHQVNTSSSLAIHRTTLLYRLGKISDISGLDINNSEEMLHVAISIKLMYTE